MVVHPVRAETELMFGGAGPEAFLGVGETERAVLGHKGGVDVVHVLGVFRGERAESGDAWRLRCARRSGPGAGRSGTTCWRDWRAPA